MDTLRQWFRKIPTFKKQDQNPFDDPLVPSRKRALTLPLPVDQVDPQQKTILQTQSDFFAKLSTELRLLIYREAFGHRSIHLVARDVCDSERRRRFWGVECLVPSFLGPGDCCSERYMYSKRLPWAKINISLLLSCRQAYSEGIDILYRANEFRFDDVYSLRTFPGSILPRRLTAVTTIVFSWPLPYSIQPHMTDEITRSFGHSMSIRQSAKREYDAVWKILATEYAGLRKLRVCLMAHGRSYPNKSAEDFERAWLDPLDMLAELHLEIFEVLVPRGYYFRLKEMAGEKHYRRIETGHLDFPVGDVTGP